MLRRLYRTPSALWRRRGAMLWGPTSRSLSNLRMCWRAWQVFPRGMRTRRCLLTRVLPRRTTTKSQLARPTGVVARGGAIARETGTAVTVNAAITSGHGATAIVKDAGLTIWRGGPKLPQTMPRERPWQAQVEVHRRREVRLKVPVGASLAQMVSGHQSERP